LKKAGSFEGGDELSGSAKYGTVLPQIEELFAGCLVSGFFI